MSTQPFKSPSAPFNTSVTGPAHFVTPDPLARDTEALTTIDSPPTMDPAASSNLLNHHLSHSSKQLVLLNKDSAVPRSAFISSQPDSSRWPLGSTALSSSSLSAQELNHDISVRTFMSTSSSFSVSNRTLRQPKAPPVSGAGKDPFEESLKQNLFAKASYFPIAARVTTVPFSNFPSKAIPISAPNEVTDDPMNVDSRPASPTIDSIDYSPRATGSLETVDTRSTLIGLFQDSASKNNSNSPHPLYLPEILLNIFRHLQSPIKTGTDPTQPLDFVKVDSIKYSLSKPRLHSCVLVNKVWNACATQLLWRNVQVTSACSYKRLLRTLGPHTHDGQLRPKSPNSFFRSSEKDIEYFPCAEHSFCIEHKKLHFVPSPVNNHLHGSYIKHFALIQPHGPGSEDFKSWNVDAIVLALALSCPNLEDLNLSNCTQVTDEPMLVLARHCLKLRKLNLNRCDLISSSTVKALAQSKSDLEILNLSRPLLSQRSTIEDNAVLLLVRKMPHLTELRLRNCDLVTDRTIIEMAKTCGSNLLALDLSWCANITDKAITEGISLHCPKLQSLALNGCKMLTDAFLSSLLAKCPSISSLSLAHLPFVTDNILQSMAMSLKNLVILSLNGCSHVGDSSIKALAQHCTQLQSLSLFSLSITDDSLKSITESCQNLISLSVSGCTEITDRGAETVSRLSLLQSLYLNQARISDRSVIAISKACPYIRALSLNDCVEISDMAIYHLSQYCSTIQSLSLNNCCITSVGIRFLLERCHDLRELSVKGCEQCAFDGEVAFKLVPGTGGLSNLKVSGDSVLQELKRRRIALIK